MDSDNSSLRISIHLEDGQVTHRFITKTDRWIIGKDRTCDVVLETSGVSRKHCRLEFQQGCWVLTDLMSLNGTVVNGVCLKASDPNAMGQVIVRSGDLIRLGTAKIYLGGLDDNAMTSILPAVSITSASPPEIPNPTPLPVAEQKDEESIKSIAVFENTVVFSSPEFMQTGKMEIFPDMESSVGALGGEDGNSLLHEVKKEKSFPFEWHGFRFLKRIGVGATGRVYLAEPLHADQVPVAIKVINPVLSQNVMERKRCMREIEINRSLSHGMIVAFKECGDFANTVYIVMEYCNAGNLSQFLLRSNRLNARRTVRLLDRLLVALSFAHSQGIVHRDLKPSNILLHKLPNGTFLPKIGDFGLAKNFTTAGHSSMTMNGSVGGTWSYMPREQLLNFRFVSPQSDVWSLGAIAYEALTAQIPRPITKGQSPVEVILNTSVQPVESVAGDVPQPLAAFLNRCLSDDLEVRFRDAAAMREALAKVAEELRIPLA
jgi:hypothetical protein